MKIKLFTHTDLDGVGCAIVAFCKFGRENVDVSYCDYHNVDERVAEFIKKEEYQHYNQIFITDISINEENAEAIHNLNECFRIRFGLFDHHEKAEWLNKYLWAKVTPKHEDDTNSSGTSLLFDYLDQPHGVFHFVEVVRRYDTWDWYNILNDLTPKRMNMLFWQYGRERFINKIMSDITAEHYEHFNEQDMLIIQIEEEKIERYIQKCAKNLIVKHIGKYVVGVVFGEQYISEACNKLHELRPELDLVAMVNLSTKKISYRTRHDDVDVNVFAQYFGGGGRPQTAGSQLSDEQVQNMLNFIFN